MEDDSAAFVRGAALLGITIPADRVERLAAYQALLLEWNERFNLIGPAATRTLWSRHFLDALTLVRALPEGLTAGECAITLLDVGSGAGLPGIPLQILFPRWQVTLLEVTAKKVQFLELAASALDLQALRVVGGRAEEVAHDREHREEYQICVARAVTHAAALVELTLPFVAPGGSVILYKGLNGLSEELEEAEPARTILGAGAPALVPVALSGEDARCLVRYTKLTRTPMQLPRRAGVPEHQPLTRADAARIEAARIERRQRHGRPRKR